MKKRWSAQTKTDDEHYVEIVEIATHKVEKRMGPMTAQNAAIVERGVLRNLDRDRYVVRTGTDVELAVESCNVEDEEG